MHCENCGFYQKSKDRDHSVCDITKIVNPRGCTYEYKPDLKICYNCKHWIGGGDWNLSCDVHPYLATTNGFRKSCEFYDKMEW